MQKLTKLGILLFMIICTLGCGVPKSEYISLKRDYEKLQSNHTYLQKKFQTLEKEKEELEKEYKGGIVESSAMHNSIKIELLQCEQEGSTVNCELLYTSSEATKLQWRDPRNKTILVDNAGNEYKAIKGMIGNTPAHKSYIARLAANTPIKGNLTFGGVNEKISKAKLIKVITSKRPYQYEFKNIRIN